MDANGPGQHVFVLEENADLFPLIRSALEPAGHHLHAFSDPTTLIDQMDSLSHSSGGLVVINADSLSQNVSQMIRRIKDHTHAIDVIVVARRPSHEDFVEALRAMASNYVVRTDDLETLIAALDRHLRVYPLAAVDLLKAYQDKQGVFRKYQDDMFRDLKTRILQLSQGALSGKTQSPRATVLVLEDEPDLQDNMAIILGDDYTVLRASDGEEALQVIQNNPQIDCAILDIHVPKLKGDALLVQLKTENPLCQVIVLTGFKESDIALKAFQDGAFDYLNKPVTDAQILAKVGEAIAVRHNIANSSAYLAVEERLRLFRLFCDTACAAHHPVTYDDLWAFFPETKTASQRSDKVLSEADLQGKNLLPFVQREMAQVKDHDRQVQQELVRQSFIDYNH